MPRARRDQDSRSRVGHTRTTPPRHVQNGTINTNTSQTQQFGSSNSTAITDSTASLAPLLVGAGSIANTTSLQDHSNNEKTLTTKILTENTDLLPSNIINDQNPASSLLTSVYNDNASAAFNGNQVIGRPNSLSTLLSQWTKKSDGIHSMDVSITAPLWMQTYEKCSLSKAVAAAQALSDTGQNDTDENAKHLRDEIRREKASRILLEQLFEEQRQQFQLKEQELENAQRENQEGERRLAEYQRRIVELQTTLATAQQALEAHHNSNELSDWVLVRQEIELTNKIIGIGGWGKVLEGRFRGTVVAVKQIHELILSPHNRRLFEREMNIAARCRHPCLLQFIGATNDDDSPLFVSELLDTSLRKVMEERELQPDEVTTISLDVARALNYLHLNHPTPIIHRDISSANVLLWKHGDYWRAKVSDYGTANFMQYSMTISPGAVVYSAPEAQTSRQSPKVDVYSFGVLLCEMNTREFPDVMRRTEQVSMVTNHLFRDLIRRCLLEDPEERPSMIEIINELCNAVFA